MKVSKYCIVGKKIDIVMMVFIFMFLFSCTDDLLRDPSYIGEGEARIDAKVNFYETAKLISSRADDDTEEYPRGGTSGNIIGNVESLCVLVYKDDGTLFDTYAYTGDPEADTLVDYHYSNDANGGSSSDGVGDNEHQAEEKTGQATFSIKVPFGKYRMYAVANMGNLKTTDETFVDNNHEEKKIKDVIDTEEGLKNIYLKWSSDIQKNNQMFGYFTLKSDERGKGFSADELIINKTDVKLHSWIKRVVSKVTVAFDGTKLNDGVEIFIKSVEIRDIPENCYLGADNKPGKNDVLIDKDQVMTYDPEGEYASEDYTSDWIGYISKNHPINGYNQEIVNNVLLSNEDKLKLLHSEDAQAFYFFENLQGEGKTNTPSDKRQQVNENHRELGVVSYPNGSDPNDIAWKDAKKYGTYIVVRAYYKSGNTIEGEGDIIYRFMLGKDVKLDYNAERNYHYKLTLRFNGWANDVDWHIDYRKSTDKEKLRIPNPFYISYLYGQSGMMPIEFEAERDVKIKQIEVEITSNSWGPDTEGSDQPEYGCDASADALAANGGNQFFNTYWLYLKPVDLPEDYPWNGFLSVRKPENLIVVQGNKPFTVYSNRNHYENTGQNKRTYPDPGSNESLEESDYTVYEAETEDKPHVAWEDGTYYVKLPIWTRARLLIKETGYTGNNPYTSYFRLAKMKVKVTLIDENENETVLETLTDSKGNEVEEVTIQQVRRVVNPKGVWRKGGSSGEEAKFNVVLMALASENATSFKPIKSDGPWRAYVLHDTYANDQNGEGGFINLTGNKYTTESTTTYEFNDTESSNVVTRDCIEGLDKQPIDFTINFNGKATDTDPGYAIIRVEYNNYTCYHLIYVRQGYGADDTFGDGTKWKIGNNISKDEVASDPRDEGSLFKFGNWTGIPASFNQNNKSWNDWVKVTPNSFIDNAAGTKSISLKDGNTTTYQGISINKDGFSKPNGMRVAKYEDFFGKLAPEEEDNQNFPIKTGVGVLYADGATETKTSLSDAYGYIAGEEGCAARGMRGIFVYDVRNGKNLFFPIGNSGYGHRKDGFAWGGPPSIAAAAIQGLLRYSTQNRWGYFNVEPGGEAATYPAGAYGAPLFLDIFRSEGAIYYFGKTLSGNSDSREVPIGWDMNYRTLNFEPITTENLGNGKDACFVRCIED